MKAVLIDDEKSALNLLTKILNKYEQISIVGVYSNPLEALGNLKTLNPDVLFIDIDMPTINGLSLAGQIINMFENIKIVFVTAYDEYALNAFQVNAIDYLLKPILPRRMDQCIDKLLKYNSNLNHKNILDVTSNYNDTFKKIFANDSGDIVLLPIEDILYFEANGKTITIQTKDYKYSSSKTLNYYENKLGDQNFFRCHKSYLINLDKIQRLIPCIRYAYDIILKNCHKKIPVSRNKASLLKQLLEY
jgi:DNA-binding LytR/AlgR family response regulator